MKQSLNTSKVLERNTKTLQHKAFLLIFLCVFVPLCFLLSLTASAQTKYFVKPNGYGKGTSWSLANKNLQSIINNASAGDTVFVAIGIYKGRFLMKEGVTVLGGYTAKSNGNFDRIYPGMAKNDDELSILDGEGQQRVLTQLIGFELPTYWEGFVIQNGKPSDHIGIGNVIYAKEDSRIAGIIYSYNSNTRQGMAIGIDEVKTQWGGYQTTISALPNIATNEKADNDKSGRENMEKIIATLGDTNMDFSSETYEKNENYAAQWCNRLDAYGYDDWYLPSCGEWEEIYQAKSSIDDVLSSVEKRLANGYWTSTQVGDLLAWTYYFESGYKHNSLKYTQQNVRSVRAFQLPVQLDDIYFAGGGAFLCNNGILMNCIVRNNESPSIGGGIYAGAGAKVLGCLIYGNTALKTSNGIYAETFKENENISAPLILNSTIAYNATQGVEFNATLSENVNQNNIIWGNQDTNIFEQDPKFIDAGNKNFLLQDNSPCLKAGNVNLITAHKIFKRDLNGYTRVLCMFDGNRYVDMGAFQQGETDYFLTLNNKEINAIRVMPNPVKAGEKLHISGISQHTNYLMQLFNSTGNLVLKQEYGNEISLTAPNKSGIYVLQLIDNDGERKSIKIMVD